MSEELVELEITDLAYDGKAVAHLDGKVVFLKGGLPGEKVLAAITRRKARYNEGIVRQIIVKSPQRIPAICTHYEYCGGCTWQDLLYRHQLEYKKKQIIDCLERIGGLKDVLVHDVVGSVELFFYRNKMEFSFNSENGADFTLGLHHRGRWDEVFDLERCHLQSEISNRIVSWIRDWIKREHIPVYNVRDHSGYMRFLMIRDAKRTGDVMINIVTNYGELPRRKELTEEITADIPQVTTIVHNQTGQRSNTAVGEIESVIYGPGYNEEKLFDYTFRIHANSFFQVNSLQTETLYRTAFDMLDPKKTDRVLDLYCGSGSIGILLSKFVKKVVGVELVEEAIKAARQNAEMNHVENIEFHHADVKEYLSGLNLSEPEFDAVVVDPPRAGLNPRVLKKILQMKPKTLMYISCNPATFARDAAKLTTEGYRLPEIRPIDMFPHTKHIELVSRFDLA